MATLLIGAAINIGASILINKFFGPEGQDVVQEGPRLRDLSITSSAPGEIRKKGYGSFRMGGNNIWSPGLQEIVRTNRQDAPGKGGGRGGSVTTRTFEYRISAAIGFGEGPAEEVVKLWADSKLIYDASGQTTGLGKYRFRFYPGDEDQLPDPLIEAAVDGELGSGSTPAYRGECYIVLEDWPLADFGNRMPNLSALIAFKSTAQKLTTTVNLSQLPGTGASGGAGIGMYNRKNDVWYVSEDTTGQVWSVGGEYEINDETTDGSASTIRGRMFGPDEAHYRQNVSGNVIRWSKHDPYTGQEIYEFAGGGQEANQQSLKLGVMRTDVSGIGPVTTQWANENSTGFGIDTGRVYIEDDDGEGNTVLQDIDELTDAERVMFDPYNHERVFWTQETATETTIYEGLVVPTVGLLGEISAAPEVVTVGTVQKGGVDIPGTPNVRGWCWLPLQNAMILAYSTGIVKFDFDTGTVEAVNTDLVGFDCEAQWSDTELFAWGENQGDFITISTSDLTEVARETVQSFFPSENDQWNDEISTYIPATHSVISIRSIGTNGATPSAAQCFLKRTTVNGEDLGTIVSDLCQDAGLDSGDIDVTDLIGITVPGFVVNTQTSLKEALRPLARAYLFDFVESDFTIKFVRRGGALALGSPIPAEDQGLAGGGPDEEPFKETRTQEVELPLRVTVNYADVDKDYQQGSQSDRRQLNPSPTVGTRNELVLNLPIALDADTARQIAQRQLYISWAERRSIETQFTQEYLALDPTDSVEMVLDTETAQVRFTKIEIGADLTMSVSSVVEDPDADTSVISGDANEGFEAQAVPDRAPTRLFALNLPLLRNQDAAQLQFSRAYFSLSGQSDRWPGGTLFRTKDRRLTYQEIAAQPAPTPWGVVQGALADPDDFYTWNPDQSFTVSMIVGGDTLETKTEDEVLSGENLGAICRRDGTVELVQWRDVTDNGDGTYELSYLLRAQKGTEEEAVSHNNGEFFVVIGPAFTNSFRLELDEINQTLEFRPVTQATMIEDAVDVFATYTGRDLKPYTVSSIAAVTDGSGNVDVSWIRNTRYAGELKDGTDDVPLNETLEQYEVDIYDNASMLTAGSPYVVNDATTFEYTVAQQTSDGVSPSDTITIEVRQISSVVGRGTLGPQGTTTHVV